MKILKMIAIFIIAQRSFWRKTKNFSSKIKHASHMEKERERLSRELHSYKVTKIEWKTETKISDNNKNGAADGAGRSGPAGVDLRSACG
uniref:Uncharacterized protein n=1 Tax=Romanomermis culicivorax TaxID=13658 RepID=A0A915JHR1_ROMCU